MTRSELIQQIFLKRSYLCVGLDTDMDVIPAHLGSQPDAMYLFNKAIIDATKDFCVAYKINTAFYEALGAKGWQLMEQTVNEIPATHFKIADAKRGDIGNTSKQYAKAFFETLDFDAITIAPFMGEDSIKPFLEYENKFAIVLGLTSNKGSEDFQRLQIAGNNPGEQLYERVIKKICEWGSTNNLMFVTGATHSAELSSIRKIIPEHFLLVPGVGAQGGSLKEVSKYGMNSDCGLLVNASRAIIYAASDESFAEKAKQVAQNYQQEMSEYLKTFIEK